MMEIPSYAFLGFSILALAFSLVTVLNRNPASAAFSLVLVFFAFAGMYAALGAHLISALQVVVYAGAIMVLFVFVIMLLNADAPSLDFDRSHFGVRIAGGLLAAALFVALVWTFNHTSLMPGGGQHSPQWIQSAGGNTRALSRLLFSDYVFPFELTSALILAGIVGAVAMAKRKSGNPDSASTLEHP